MKINISLMFFLIAYSGFTQTGSIQVFSQKDVKIYLDGAFKGNYGGHETGFYIADVPPGPHTIRGTKDGYENNSVEVTVLENENTVVHLQLEKKAFYRNKTYGLSVNVGSLGAFKYSDTLTRSYIMFGVTPFIQKSIPNSRRWAIGGECGLNWFKPDSQDKFRMMVNPNLRLNYFIRLFHAFSLNIEMSGGFSWMPKNTRTAYLSPTFNEQRYGWNAQGSLGTFIQVTRQSVLTLNLGYLYGNTTSNNNEWISVQSIVFSFGTRVFVR